MPTYIADNVDAVARHGVHIAVCRLQPEFTLAA